MRKVGLLELAHHNEVLRSYLLILLNKDLEITVFTNEWIFEQLYDLQKHPKIRWVLRKSSQSSTAFLESVTEEIQNQDLIIQTTNEDDTGKLIIPPSNKTALVVHDLLTYLSPLKSSSKRLVLDFPRLLKFYLQRRGRLMQSFNNAKFIILPSQKVLEYANEHFPQIDKFTNLPFTVNDEISEPLSRKEITVTIPGNISIKSRNYSDVVKAFKNVESRKPINLILLGRPGGERGRQIILQFKKLKNIKVKTYNEFVPQTEFDKIMRATDFLILPMNKIMKFGVINEVNGYTCVSGNMNDMIRFGLPALIPTTYPLQVELKAIAGTYSSSEDLRNLINSWIESEKYNEIKSLHMKKAMEAYSKSNLGKLFSHNFNSKNSRKL